MANGRACPGAATPTISLKDRGDTSLSRALTIVWSSRIAIGGWSPPAECESSGGVPGSHAAGDACAGRARRARCRGPGDRMALDLKALLAPSQTALLMMECQEGIVGERA